VTRRTLGLDGSEVIDIAGVAGGPSARSELACTIRRSTGETAVVNLRCRLDTSREVEYYRHGGLLHCVLRQRLAKQRRSAA
jgi:aconitate hydratase